MAEKNSLRRAYKKADEWITNALIGTGYGITNQFEGLYQMAAHPVQTAQGIGQMVSRPREIPGMVANALVDTAKRATSGPMGFGEVLGENLSPSMFRRNTLARRDIFAGPKAKTADIAALDRAKQMLAEGADDAQVWRETGWWVNTPDGVPRFEIDDKAARLKVGTDKSPMSADEAYTLPDVIDHPQALSAYDFGKVDVYPDQGRGPGKGAYHDDLIDIGVDDTGRQASRGVLLHEMQHNIQDIENMGRGGDSTIIWANTKTRPVVLKEAQRIFGDWKPATIEEFWGNAPIDADAQKEYAKYLKQFNSKESKDQRWLIAQQSAGKEVYKRLAGEVEARAVQKRMFWPEDKRRSVPPWESYDVPPNALIVRR
jgi:hypothetical protein